MTTPTVQNAVTRLESKLTPDKKARLASVIGFHFKDTGEDHTLDASGPQGRGWLSGAPETHGLSAPFAVTLTSDDFARLVFGELNPMAGMVTGRMKLRGNLKEALKLDALLKD